MGAVEQHDLRKYVLERKYDGHRAILLTERGRNTLFTRHRTPIIAGDYLGKKISEMDLPDGTVLDGEIWNPLKRGGWATKGGERNVITFWDCIRKGQEDVSRNPIERRYEILKEMLGSGNEGVRVCDQEDATGEAIDRAVREFITSRRGTGARSGFVHGVVLKLRGSTRRDHATRSREHSDWLKIVFDGMV